MNLSEKQAYAEALVAWYASAHRRLPWRPKPGALGAAYPVWVSEIMLQQTTVATVIPYFLRFQERWPTVGALAASSLDELLQTWQGLGYYSRAQNMHKTAGLVAAAGGVFPETRAALLELPGIGPYTASAIAAFAFGAPETVVDGNVKRVVARLFGLLQPLSAMGPEIVSLAESLTPPAQAADYGQAIMDLGATICTPRAPLCDRCPVQAFCAAYRLELQDVIPFKTPKAQKPRRWGVVLWIESAGQVVVRKRPEKGLLAHMTEFPTPVWQDGPLPEPSVRHAAAASLLQEILGDKEAPMTPHPTPVVHVFTHFHLTLEVWRVVLPAPVPLQEGRWVFLDALDLEALPTLMQKVRQR